MSGSPSTTPSLRPTRPPRGLGVGVGGRGGGDWTRGLLLGPAVVLGPVVAPPLRGPWPDATNSSEGARALSAAALTREVGASGLRLAPVCVLASAFSVILLLCAAPSVLALSSCGAGPRDAALGRWPPSRGVPSAAPGPTRPTFLRARVPSRPPPSHGKLGPWGFFFFSLRRRYRADEGGGLPPKPGKPAHRTQDKRRTRTKTPSTDAKAEVWSSGAGSGPDPTKPPTPPGRCLLETPCLPLGH
jgi:hypothetical protein